MPSSKGMRSLIRRKKKPRHPASSTRATSSSATEAEASSSQVAAMASQDPVEASIDDKIAVVNDNNTRDSPNLENDGTADSSLTIEASLHDDSASEDNNQTYETVPNISALSISPDATPIIFFEDSTVTPPQANTPFETAEDNDAPNIIEIPSTPQITVPPVAHMAIPGRNSVPLIPLRPAPPPPVGLRGFGRGQVPGGYRRRRESVSFPNGQFGAFPQQGAPAPAFRPAAHHHQRAQTEHFPELQFSPFHRNQLTGAEQRRITPWELPGRDIFRSPENDRSMSGHWMGGPFELVRVGDQDFRVPMRLLQRHQFWSTLSVLERPQQGWAMNGVEPEIFAVLMECVYSTSGLHGTEPGLNLVKIYHAIILAWKWGMRIEYKKLRDTTRRYVVRKMLARNPFLPDPAGDMNHNYFVYRSEEIYRCWEISQRYPILEKALSTGELVALYATTIPNNLWPALTTNFKQEFAMLIDLSSAVRQHPAEQTFEDWWWRFFQLSGYLDYEWFSPRVLSRISFNSQPERRQDEDDHPVPPHARAEFEAARARGDALMAAIDTYQQQAAAQGADTSATEGHARHYPAPPNIVITPPNEPDGNLRSNAAETALTFTATEGNDSTQGGNAITEQLPSVFE